ncbi:MAG: hypothetical protein H7Z70_00945 [Bacteroidia bacterium]|nr:hypothetical protein [Methylotenera sp.]
MPQKILTVKTTLLGNDVHKLPMMTDILAHLPNIQFNQIVGSLEDILKLHPYFNRIINLGFRRWCKVFFSKQTWREIFATNWQLQFERYNESIHK